MPPQIVEIRPIDDCIGNSSSKEVLFDSLVTKDFIEYLGAKGELEYHPAFPRPFFRIDVSGVFILKGVEGRNSARLILDCENMDHSLSYFKSLIESYSRGIPASNRSA